jgi:uncharacterized coiled-coil DUF342 family protein
MAILGWGTVAGVAAKIVDSLWPSKKAALYDKLKQLESDYSYALINKQDTKAAEIKKQIDALRKKIEFTGGEI